MQRIFSVSVHLQTRSIKSLVPRISQPIVSAFPSQFLRFQSTVAAIQTTSPEQNDLGAPPRTVPFHVPSIDIAPFLEDPKSAASSKIISEVRAACLSTGFFVISNHGVPINIQNALFEAAEKLFKLPFHEKKKLDCKTKVGHRGYDVLASQSYEAGVLPDLKEGFYVGTDIPEDDSRAVARRFYMGPNVWPSTSLLPHAQLKEPAEAYYAAIYQLSLQVLDMIFATLPASAQGKLTEFTNPELVAAPLRLLHYPPAQKTEQRQLGSSAHTDFGAITLLLQDGNPGLEVLDQTTDTWKPIEPIRNSYVVNVGDMLEKWTGGAFKSSMHRVINKNPTDRYSIVFFYDGNLDCALSPLFGDKADENVLTVEGHMIDRMTRSYHGKDPTVKNEEK